MVQIVDNGIKMLQCRSMKSCSSPSCLFHGSKLRAKTDWSNVNRKQHTTVLACDLGRLGREIATVWALRHSMAFSSSLFPFFRDVNGQPLTSRDKWGYPLDNKACYKGNSALAMLLEDCFSLTRLILRKNLL